MLLGEFNALAADVAERELTACTAVPRFAREVAAGRPYPTVADLATTAAAAVAGLDWAEVRTALDAHPRIGQRVAAGSASQREQAAVTAAGADVQQALAAGNAEYERRFGHVFLIRAAGRTPEQILAELTRRLGSDEATERAETTAQLAEITRLRVERMVSG